MQQHPLLALAFENSFKVNQTISSNDKYDKRQDNSNNGKYLDHDSMGDVGKDNQSSFELSSEKIDLNYLDSALFSLNSAIRDTKFEIESTLSSGLVENVKLLNQTEISKDQVEKIFDMLEQVSTTLNDSSMSNHFKVDSKSLSLLELWQSHQFLTQKLKEFEMVDTSLLHPQIQKRIELISLEIEEKLAQTLLELVRIETNESTGRTILTVKEINKDVCAILNANDQPSTFVKPLVDMIFYDWITPILKHPDTQMVSENDQLEILLSPSSPTSQPSSPKKLNDHLHHVWTSQTIHSLFDLLKTTFQYISSHFTKDDQTKPFLTLIGNSLIPQTKEAMISKSIRHCIPRHSHEFQNFIDLIEIPASQFEHELIEILGFHTREANHLLKDYSSQVMVHYIHHKRKRVLETMKDYLSSPHSFTPMYTQHSSSSSQQSKHRKELILDLSSLNKNPATLNNDSIRLEVIDNVIPSTDSSMAAPSFLSKNIFQFPHCQTTKTALLIHELIMDIIEEASQLQGKIRADLIKVVRDVLDLYLVQADYRYAHDIQKDPVKAMLFHNDCMYLGHQSMLLSWIRSVFSESDQIFLNHVTLFREKAIGTFHFHLKFQRNKILNILSQATKHGMLDVSTTESTESCGHVMNSLVHTFNELTHLLEPILTPHLRCKFIGHLLNDVQEKLIGLVMDMTDIAVEESERLYAVLSLLFPLQSSLFDFNQFSRVDDHHLISSAGIGGVDIDMHSIYLERYVPLNQKYQELVEILNMKLVDIMEKFQEGRIRLPKRRKLSGFGHNNMKRKQMQKQFKANGTTTNQGVGGGSVAAQQQSNNNNHDDDRIWFKSWSGQELSRMVRALFSDTPNRQRALKMFEKDGKIKVPQLLQYGGDEAKNKSSFAAPSSLSIPKSNSNFMMATLSPEDHGTGTTPNSGNNNPLSSTNSGSPLDAFRFETLKNTFSPEILSPVSTTGDSPVNASVSAATSLLLPLVGGTSPLTETFHINDANYNNNNFLNEFNHKSYQQQQQQEENTNDSNSRLSPAFESVMGGSPVFMDNSTIETSQEEYHHKELDHGFGNQQDEQEQSLESQDIISLTMNVSDLLLKKLKR